MAHAPAPLCSAVDDEAEGVAPADEGGGGGGGIERAATTDGACDGACGGACDGACGGACGSGAVIECAEDDGGGSTEGEPRSEGCTDDGCLARAASRKAAAPGDSSRGVERCGDALYSRCRRHASSCCGTAGGRCGCCGAAGGRCGVGDAARPPRGRLFCSCDGDGSSSYLEARSMSALTESLTACVARAACIKSLASKGRC
jgi:hypothetical protein